MTIDTINGITFLTGMFFGGLTPVLILSRLSYERSFFKNMAIAWGCGVPAGALINYGIALLMLKYAVQ